MSMIKVMSKKSFMFHRAPVGKSAASGEEMYDLQKMSRFVLEPTAPGCTVDAPEWIRDTDLFKLAVKDRSVTEVTGIPVATGYFATQADVEFLKERAYKISTIADATRFVNSLSPEHLDAYRAEIDKWKASNAQYEGAESKGASQTGLGGETPNGDEGKAPTTGAPESGQQAPDDNPKVQEPPAPPAAPDTPPVAPVTTQTANANEAKGKGKGKTNTGLQG